MLFQVPIFLLGPSALQGAVAITEQLFLFFILSSFSADGLGTS